uniref:Fibronectin type-III domain-containing protein n=1 Tax=Soboliphyme baturini TaxID=241478 RepID=A0A183IMJ1_9BILA
LTQPVSSKVPQALDEQNTYPCSAADVANVTVQHIRREDGIRVPSPTNLLIERILTKSILISWQPPTSSLVVITQYHVCVDEVVRNVIPAGYKTKALIEDVDCQKAHRISVRAVTEAGHSPDPACTVSVGKRSNVAPQDVKASCITPVSAQISWYPGNSNYETIVLLNGTKVGGCPPGVYQVLLKGLTPMTRYRCSIRVKDPVAVLEEKPVEIGLPDPPADVQCELGPQDGTLLVTWQPVTNQPKPPSLAAVTGYLLYADGKKISDMESPTGDHVLLRWSDLCDDPPLFITVKTKTKEGAISADSNAVRVPRFDSKQPSTYRSSDTLMAAAKFKVSAVG